VFFAGVTFFVAFIPAVGAGSACLGVALMLFVTGHAYAALFLALWALVVVALVDNLIKPLLIKHGMEMRGAVVFFSLIGGLAAFGAVGLLLGTPEDVRARLQANGAEGRAGDYLGL
jgi:predicted PurR-regulated permease PerM